MRCAQCGSRQETDSNFCDECGAALAAEAKPSVEAKPANQAATSMPERAGWVQVFSTTDFGELALFKSLLNEHGIPNFEPNHFAERYSMWTSGFFRQFSLAVPEHCVKEANTLIQEHAKIAGEKQPWPHQYTVARILLALVILTSLASLFFH